MKAINTPNRTNNQMKHMVISLSMLLFLLAANTVFAGNNGDNNNPGNKNKAAGNNSVTMNELEASPVLTVENTMVFSFSVPKGQYVRFSLYDVKGNEISVLINDNSHNGEVKADLSNAFVKNGVFYYCLVAGEYKEVRKLNVYAN